VSLKGHLHVPKIYLDKQLKFQFNFRGSFFLKKKKKKKMKYCIEHTKIEGYSFF